MGEGTAPSPFETFYKVVQSAYNIGCEDTNGKAHDLYQKSPRKISAGLVEHLRGQLGEAPLLDSSGIERVVRDLSRILLAFDHVGLSTVLGDAMETMDLTEQEALQQYFQEALNDEEDTERKTKLQKAMRSLTSSQ